MAFKKLSGIALVALFATRLAFSANPDIELANLLFDEGKYQHALVEYERVAELKPTANNRENRNKALYRTIESEALLRRYQSASDRAKKIKLPEDPIWKSRFLILRSEVNRIASNFSNQDHLEHQLTSDFAELIKLRGPMAQVLLKNESYFFNTKDKDLENIPTLFDFALLKISEHLSEKIYSRSAKGVLDFEIFLSNQFSSELDFSKHPAISLASLYELSYLTKGSSKTASLREPLREIARVKRWMIPRDFAVLFPKFKENDHERIRARIVQTLVSKMENFRSDRGKTKNLLTTAQLYQENEDYKNAVVSCEIATKNWPHTPEARSCRELVAEIQTPILELKGTTTPPPGTNSIAIRVRNIGEVSLKGYRVELAWLGDRGKDWSFLRQRLSEQKIKELQNKKPDLEWKTKITYPAPYSFYKANVSPPPLEPGFYVFTGPGDIVNMQATLVHVTDAFLIGTVGIEPQPAIASPLFTPKPNDPNPASGMTAGQEPVFHLYALD